MRVTVAFPPASLRTSNAALDLAESALRYRDALEAALREALPAHDVEVVVDPDARGLAVWCDTSDEALARAVERDVLDHAWVVRQMSDWCRMS